MVLSFCWIICKIVIDSVFLVFEFVVKVVWKIWFVLIFDNYVYCVGWYRMIEDVMNVDEWGLIIKVMVDICSVVYNLEDYLCIV